MMSLNTDVKIILLAAPEAYHCVGISSRRFSFIEFHQAYGCKTVIARCSARFTNRQVKLQKIGNRHLHHAWIGIESLSIPELLR